MLSNAKNRYAALLFGFLVIVYALTVSKSPSIDAVAAQYGSWRISQTGAPWIESLNFLEGRENRWTWITLNGSHEVISRSPGPVAFGVPAYFFFGGTEFSVLPGALSAAFITAVSVTLMFLALCHHLDLRQSLVVAVVLGLGTPVWSVAADAMWPHTLTVLGISGMAWASASRRWVLAGVFGGVAVWGRFHMALAVAALGLLEAWRARDWRIAARIGIVSLAITALLLPWGRWIYGEWLITGNRRLNWAASGAERYESLVANELGLFLGLGRGVFVWTPLLLVLLPALRRAWPELPSWTKSMAIGGIVYTLVQGYLNGFAGGDTFWGYRLGIECVVSVTPALALSLGKLGTAGRKLVGPLAVLQIIVIAVGAMTGDPGVLPEQGWWPNPVAQRLALDPSFGILLIVVSIVLAVLVPRVVWRDYLRRGETIR